MAGTVELIDACEAFWIKNARLALGTPKEATDGEVLEKLRPFVSELSDLFTTERPERFRDYMSEACLLAAYGLFFFPQSFSRARFVFERLLGFCGWKPGACENSSGVLRVLDLGSGAAPSGIAVAGALHERFPKARVELTAVDRSRSALEMLQKIPLPEWLKISTQVADLSRFAGTQQQFDVILLGWSLNEIVPAGAEHSVEEAIVFLKKMAGALMPTGVLVVLEPALKETAERLQRASDYFARNPGLPFFRIAPELGEHLCPFLTEGIAWNHEVRKWDAPASLEFLNRKLFREIQVLKFSWVALSKAPGIAQNPDESLLRLVSPLELTKASLRFLGVNTRGEKLAIEIPTRGMSKSERKKIAETWQRGDIARCTGTLSPLGIIGHFRLTGTLIKVG